MSRKLHFWVNGTLIVGIFLRLIWMIYPPSCGWGMRYPDWFLRIHIAESSPTGDAASALRAFYLDVLKDDLAAAAWSPGPEGLEHISLVYSAKLRRLAEGGNPSTTLELCNTVAFHYRGGHRQVLTPSFVSNGLTSSRASPWPGDDVQNIAILSPYCKEPHTSLTGRECKTTFNALTDQGTIESWGIRVVLNDQHPHVEEIICEPIAKLPNSPATTVLRRRLPNK
jgi:hypothetical protein